MADKEEPPLKRRKGKEPVPSEPQKTLYLELCSARAVRKRLEILDDSHLNPYDLATIEFSLKRGLIFIVRNDVTSVCAMLFFDEYVEETFICTQRYVKPRYLQLHQIVMFLVGATDEHTLSIFQFEDSPNELHFMITSPSGIGSSQQLKVNLTENKFNRFTRFHAIFKIQITPNTLAEILEQLEQAHHRSVLVDVKRDVVKISTVGNSDQGRSWRVPREDIPAGVNHRALFRLSHLEAMRLAASIMGEDTYLFLLVKPRDHTLVHSKLKDFGHVSFYYKAKELKTVPNEDAPDDNAPDEDAPDGDAAGEAAEPGGDAAQALQTGGEVVEPLQPSGDVAQASQPGSDAADDAAQL